METWLLQISANIVPPRARRVTTSGGNTVFRFHWPLSLASIGATGGASRSSTIAFLPSCEGKEVGKGNTAGCEQLSALGEPLAQCLRKGFAFTAALFWVLAPQCSFAWFPPDALQGFDEPISLNVRVHRWQLTGGGNIVPFNGLTQYLNLGNDALLNVSAHDFSVEVWVLFNSLASPDPSCTDSNCLEMSLADKMSSDPVVNGDGWRLMKTADNRFRFCLGNDADGCTAGSTTAVQTAAGVTAGTWYHVVGCKSSDALSLVVNAHAAVTVGLGAFVDTGGADLLIGRDHRAGAFLNGTIDTVGLYSRALKGDQIRKLYQQGRRRHQDQSSPSGTSSRSTIPSIGDTIDVLNESAFRGLDAPVANAGQLVVSSSSDRTEAVPLDGKSLSGQAYIFALPNAGARQVMFWLDNRSPTTVEYLAPFDFRGTNPNGTAWPLDTGQLGKGVHTLSARITMNDGTVLPVITATFTVR